MDTDTSAKDILLAEAEIAVAELYSAAALSMPWLKDEDIGDGHPVMVMPGFFCGDQFTAAMRYFLGNRGFSVYGWELSPAEDCYGSGAAMRDLRAHLRSLHDRYQRKVTLLAWGVGRAYAHDLASNCSDCVRQAILLGACSASAMSDGTGRQPGCESLVPMTSIFSDADRAVSWQCNDGAQGSSRENIELFRGRCGRTFNPGVLNAIVKCLATTRSSHDATLDAAAFGDTNAMLYQTLRSDRQTAAAGM